LPGVMDQVISGKPLTDAGSKNDGFKGGQRLRGRARTDGPGP
jgi:hypothetical protein